MRGFVRLAAAAAAILLAACAPVNQAPSEPADPSRVEFMDSATFDHQLAEALHTSQDEVTVVPLAPVGLNQMPQRLDKWLSAVKESGGKVKAAPVETTADGGQARGIIGVVIDVVLSLFDLGREKALYSSAANYDAMLFYDKASGQVKEMVLRKRHKPEG